MEPPKSIKVDLQRAWIVLFSKTFSLLLRKSTNIQQRKFIVGLSSDQAPLACTLNKVWYDSLLVMKRALIKNPAVLLPILKLQPISKRVKMCFAQRANPKEGLWAAFCSIVRFTSILWMLNFEHFHSRKLSSPTSYTDKYILNPLTFVCKNLSPYCIPALCCTLTCSTF